MFHHLDTLAQVGISVDISKTKHQIVLTTEDLQVIYKEAVAFHFKKDPIWRGRWLGMTINQLVNKLVS